MRPRAHFEPEEWHQIYRGSVLSPARQLFRNVTEKVYDLASPLILAGQRWMELGCGTGELCKRISRPEVDIFAIDNDEAMVRWVNRQPGVSQSPGLFVADATFIPFSGRSINGVVAASLTGCLEDIDMFWKEVSRILVPGGYAVLSFTNKHNIFLGISNLWYKHGAKGDSQHPCHGFFKRYDELETLQSAAANNLVVRQICYFNCFLFPNWKGKLFDSFPLRTNSGIAHFALKKTCRHFVLVLQKAQNI